MSENELPLSSLTPVGYPDDYAPTLNGIGGWMVVIVIGGIGSIRGALVASLLVGLVDTAGRALLPPLLREVLSPSLAADIGPAVASIAMYVLMAGVLVFKPSGLFPARG